MAHPHSTHVAAVTLTALLLVACEPPENKSDLTAADTAPGADSEDARQPQSPHEQNCGVICEAHAQCGKSCDYNEEPDCDEEKNYQTTLAECIPACEQGASNAHGGCPSAADLYRQCMAGQECNAYFEKTCTTEKRRFHELCLSEPGWLVCFHFCTALEVGCMNYESVGFRGKGCEEACKQSANDLDCLETHYALDTCMGTQGYACGPFPELCQPQLDALVATCEKWAPAQVDQEQLMACQTYAVAQCRCGLFSGEACEALATQRCLFAFGRGQACIDATKAFHECMDPIPDCNRDVMREQCEAIWNTYYSECNI